MSKKYAYACIVKDSDYFKDTICTGNINLKTERGAINRLKNMFGENIEYFLRPYESIFDCNIARLEAATQAAVLYPTYKTTCII